MRPTNVSDARAFGFVPSVTTVIDRTLRKYGLELWKAEQLVLAVETTPRLPNEADDDFVRRVVQVECHQDAEAKAARDRGTAIHDLMARVMRKEWVDCDHPMFPWIDPALSALHFGKVIAVEKVLVGPGYAGTTDLIQESPDAYMLTDYKTSKTLPKEPYIEHKLQLSAYAEAWQRRLIGDDRAIYKKIRVRNVYVSTTEVGKYSIHEHLDWQTTYEHGFKPLLQYFNWVNNL